MSHHIMQLQSRQKLDRSMDKSPRSSPGDELDPDEGDGSGHAEHGQDQQLPVEPEEGRVEEAAAGGHRLHELEDRERGGRLLLEEAAQN